MKLQIGDKVRFLNEKGEAVVTQIINKKMVKVAIEEGFEIPVPMEELILVQNPQSPIPNPQSPIPNPQSLIPNPQSPITNTTKEQPTASSVKMRNESIQQKNILPQIPQIFVKNTSNKSAVISEISGKHEKFIPQPTKATIIQKQKIKRDILDFSNALTTEEVDLHIEELIDDHRGMSNAEIVLTQLQYFQKRLDRAIANNHRKIVFIHGVGNGTLKREIRNILKTYNRIHFQDADIRRYGLGATEVEIK